MKVVVDTNIIISGIFFGGNPRTLIDYFIDEKLSFIASPVIIDEYRTIFEQMLQRQNGFLDENLFQLLFSKIIIIDANHTYTICRDPDDNKFLDCAVAAQADCIVSGDNDLLELKECNSIPIITVKDFLEKYFSDEHI